jgi:peptide deformylase
VTEASIPPAGPAAEPAVRAAPLPILRFGDPRLERVCAPVPRDADPAILAARAEAMLATIHGFRARHGWGRAIAAPQVGILSRMVALAIDGVETILLDPEIVWRSPEVDELWDDCMSLPEIAVRVPRHRSVSVRYRDLSGREAAFERAAPDLSELLQHEIDHLDGVLMTRRMRPGTPIVARENRALALPPSSPAEE